MVSGRTLNSFSLNIKKFRGFHPVKLIPFVASDENFWEKMTVANLQSSKKAVFVPKRVASFLNNKHKGCFNVTIGQWP